ncbi:hypothetical protein JOQ06_007487 [Pogonophryne albipinna]|uniref:Uncharacterized protein n=1 Tax=Pogonophryne albipinna TaxID=1090488 RepID=A0AAD6FI96_9TELE|nr:hypothetical protein JOQ06_007487 [Pogonophryne albipinna]
MVPGTRELVGAAEGSGAEPPAPGHKEGEKGNYGILYQAGQRRRIFSKETGEREKLQCSREGGEEERRRKNPRTGQERDTERDASSNL